MLKQLSLPKGAKDELGIVGDHGMEPEQDAPKTGDNEDQQSDDEDVKKEKNKVVKSQKYEEAAQLRDREKKLIAQLEEEKTRWEEETRTKRYQVGEDNVADVIAMMTGIPTKRIAENESAKLLTMVRTLLAR